MRLLFIPALLVSTAEAFVPGWTTSVSPPALAFSNRLLEPPSSSSQTSSSTSLFAKKKKGPAGAANAKLAALEALEALEVGAELDAPLSKKEQIKLEKQKEKEEAAAAAEQASADEAEDDKPKMSKKEEKLMKAMEMEAMDNQSEDAFKEADDQPNLSKKELKALKKKEEKLAAQAARKAEKKAAKAADLEGATAEVEVEELGVPANGDAAAEPAPPKLTLEDKVRKERPPPRIRVMESAQPGYVALRLEKVGIMFRNQEVLNDVTWGVQTGDRVGLVGKNGAGKTTQLRILAGELEPTTGDVVKSSGDLRTAMLRQEFVDELVPDRTLREEFLSVFEEENKILEDMRQTELALENMGDEDPERMQEILDRMQELQQKAEDKDVYLLESRVKKTMNLMGFNDEEAEDLVASFSGGWKMRIGLGKVLLKDPNVLLLGKWVLDYMLRSLMCLTSELMFKHLFQTNLQTILISTVLNGWRRFCANRVFQ
jgi:ABC-type cobalamin/Fe3+-siderophores transport system ATPase subunit